MILPIFVYSVAVGMAIWGSVWISHGNIVSGCADLFISGLLIGMQSVQLYYEHYYEPRSKL